MTPTIHEALSPYIRTSHAPDRTAGDTYVAYQILGQEGTLYAEGSEQETGTTAVVNVYAPGPDLLATMLMVKDTLEAAGYIVEVDQEIHETETDTHRWVLIATTEGAAYG